MDKATVEQLLARTKEEYYFFRADWKKTKDASVERKVAYLADRIVWLEQILKEVDNETV